MPNKLAIGTLVDSPKGRGVVIDVENVLVRVGDYWHLWTECTPVPATPAPQPVAEPAGGHEVGERRERYETYLKQATAAGDKFPAYEKWLEDCLDYRLRENQRLATELAQTRQQLAEARALVGEYQSKWMAVSKQLAELRVAYDELGDEFEAQS